MVDEGRLLQLFETQMLVIDAACEFFLTYNRERPLDEDSGLGW